jgi:hypothetical protein
MKDIILGIDQHGLDPFKNDLMDEIFNITECDTVTVGAKYVSNPQLMSYDYLGNVELYFIILMYNGLGNSFKLERDMTILVPKVERVKEILSRRTVAKIQRISI